MLNKCLKLFSSYLYGDFLLREKLFNYNYLLLLLFGEKSLSGGCVAREEKQSLNHFLFRSQSVIDFSWIRTSTVISTRTVSLSFAWKKLIIENRVQKRIPPVRFSYFLYLLFISFKTKKKKENGIIVWNCLVSFLFSSLFLCDWFRLFRIFGFSLYPTTFTPSSCYRSSILVDFRYFISL